MRSIGQLSTEAEAARFCDAMYICSIAGQSEQEDDGTFSIWVEDEGEVPRARELLKRFLANPAAPEFVAASEAAEKQRRGEAQTEKPGRSEVIDTARLGYERNFVGVPYFTLFLIVASVAMVIYTRLGDDRRAMFPFLISLVDRSDGLGGPFLPEVGAGQVWRLITPIFVHFGVLHIVFNMMLLKDLGTFIESRFSGRYLAALVVGTAVFSNLGQYLVTGYPLFGGMSGVDYGLFGFLWMRGKCDRYTNWEVNKNTVYMMIGWFVLCLVGIIPNVANYCHGVGLGVGMLWGYLSSGRLFSRASR